MDELASRLTLNQEVWLERPDALGLSSVISLLKHRCLEVVYVLNDMTNIRMRILPRHPIPCGVVGNTLRFDRRISGSRPDEGMRELLREFSFLLL